MSEPEKFLARWSRRKHQGATEAPATNESQPEASTAPPIGSAEPAQAEAGDAAEPAPVTIDLTTLPSLDSIAADTDIRAFLAPGVPADLRVAALRRAWVADPKVRNFVGLADYDWDFHTPGALPGFGPLEMTDDLRREVVRIVSGWQGGEAESSEPLAPAPEMGAPLRADHAAPSRGETDVVAPAGPSKDVTSPSPAAVNPPAAPEVPFPTQVIMQRSEIDIAPQQEIQRPESSQMLARRAHGRALPQ